MSLSELDKIAKDISYEALKLLEKTDTPPLPPYFSKAFLDVAQRYGAEVEGELTKRIASLDAAATGKNLEDSLEFARDALREYSETTTRLKEIVQDQDPALDLKKLETENMVPVAILEELRAHYLGLSDEVKKAETTIRKLEDDLSKLEMDSYVDPLTRLRTPTLLRRQLSQILEAGHNRNLDLWVALLEIDDYQRLKEECGYVVMEKVLLFMAKSLQGTIRADNRIYRYNENPKNEGVFCIVFNRMDKQGAYLAAGRVRSRVEASKLVYAERVINITVSAAIVPHRAADSVESLCSRAEMALAKIPSLGLNAIHVVED